MTRLVHIIGFLCWCGLALAFQTPRAPTTAPSTCALCARIKRGKLGQEIDVAAAAPVRRSTKKTVKKAAGDASNISPALAAYLATQDDTKDSSGNVPPVAAEEKKTPKKKASKKAKGVRQSALQVAEQANNEIIMKWTKDFNKLLKEGKPSLDDLLGRVRQVLDMPSGNLKQLSASANRQDFRLAWVGSDEAICHVGTGLHKVPLARLQEVFLSFKGQNRVEVQEVIRILGPFPNVKNTLQGPSTFSRQEDSVVEWRVTWDSMLDGTGKEIMAGKQENIRQVDLQVYFCSPSVVVAVVPPDSDAATRRADPLEDNGKHVLVFVKEDNLQEELDKLRVA